MKIRKMLFRRIFHYMCSLRPFASIFRHHSFPLSSAVMLSMCSRLAATVSQLTIEPIVFFNFFALSFFHVSQHATLYRSVCLSNYQFYNPTVQCGDLSKNGPELEDRIQEDASNWNMLLSLCYLLPAVASDIVLGAWSDRHGRKTNILIGLTGLTAACVASIALAVFPLMSLYVLCASNAVAGSCGGVAIVMISSYSYLTDVVESKKALTTRMLVVQVFRYMADVLGSLLFSRISRMTNLAVTLLIAQCFFVVAFFYALVRLHQMPPAEMRRFMSLQRAKRKSNAVIAPKYGIGEEDQSTGDTGKNGIVKFGSGMNTGTCDAHSSAMVQAPVEPEEGAKEGLCGYVYRLYHGVWYTIVRQRPGNQRTYILLCSLVYFVYMMSEIGLQGSIFSLYVFHRPFFWSPSELGQYRGVQNLCSFVVNLLGALLVNKCIHADDTTIMLLGVGTGAIHLVLVGLAKDTWSMYAAAIFASFGSLLIPALKSFMVRTVDDHEVGRTLAANGIAADFAFVASTLVYTNLYTFTVSTCASAVFFVGAGLVVLCFFATFWIRRDHKRTRDVVLIDHTAQS